MIGKFRSQITATTLVSVLMCLPATAQILPGITSTSDYEEQLMTSETLQVRDMSLTGAQIRSISVTTHDIFDVDSPQEDTLLFKLGNFLHVRTREETVRSLLLFETGQALDYRALEETERLLRNKNYLFDASIRPTAQEDGSVDVEVITRDLWTLKPGFSYGRAGGENTGGFDLEELNLLGTGSRFVATINQQVDRTVRKIAYRNPNLGGSWWDLTTILGDNSDGKSHSVTLKRPFYSMDTRRAGSVSYDFVKQRSVRYDLGKLVDQYDVRTIDFESSFGWSAGFQQGWTNRYSLGIKYNHSDFTAVASTADLPEDRKLVYPWFAFERRQDNHQKDHNISHINRTEDVDLSWKVTAVMGYASPDFGADRDALLLGGTLRKGLIFQDRHTLFLSGDVNVRYEQDSWQDLLYHQQFNYYLRQAPQWLFYLAGGLDVSHNLDEDSQVQLGGDSGLRGYPLRYQSGEGRWLLTAEQRYFSNWYPFRLFTVGAAVFADMGSVFGDVQYGSESRGVLTDLGFGLRIGNHRSGIGGVLHLDLAFPVNASDDIDNVQFLVQTKSSF